MERNLFEQAEGKEDLHLCFTDYTRIVTRERGL